MTGVIDRDTTNGGLEATRASGGPVLVVEDDEACRALMVALLDRIGCAVEEAASGEEALALAKANPPALVLLDIGIPGISGYEVCHELRETFGQTLPVVFVSGNRVETQDRIAGLLIGGFFGLVAFRVWEVADARSAGLASTGASGATIWVAASDPRC